MRYLLALLVPPVAVLLCGKPIQAVLNAVVWVLGLFTLLLGVGFFVVPVAVIHAVFVVSARLADNRQRSLVEALRQ